MGVAKVILNNSTLMDVTTDTVTANTLALGSTATGADGNKITGTLVASSGGSSTEKNVKFIDYDGTVVYSYTTAEALELTALPSNPSHTGLTAQGWNWSLSDIQDYLDDYPDADVIVGQMYITTSGATEIDVTLPSDSLSPWLQICPNGTVNIDWGDGSAIETCSGSSVTVPTWTNHTYAIAGNYTIALSVSGNNGFSFYTTGSSASNYACVLSSRNSLSESLQYSQCIKAIRLGSNYITEIKSQSFSRCRQLETITVPSYITSISSYAISMGTNLKAFVMPPNTIWSSPFGSTLSSLKYCSFPKTTITTTFDGFMHARSLEAITIPIGIQTLEGMGFYNCYSLKKIVIPEGVTTIKNQCFENCYKLRSVDFPSTLTTISGNYVFQNCRSLESFILPTGVTTISGNNVCSNCDSLTTAVIPNTVTSLGHSLFSSCFNLESVSFSPNIQTLPQSTFSNCIALKTISLPSTITTFGINVFSPCPNLETIVLSSDITSIGSSAFSGCSKLKSFSLSSSLTALSTSMFYNCLSLKEINIPSSVTEIPQNFFYGCSSLESVTFSTNVTSIGASAFYNCASLKQITIPNGVTAINNSCFSFCYSLEKIVIPSNVTSIGTSAFSSCLTLSELHFLPLSPPNVSNSNTFTKLPTNCIIYVPTGTLADYTSATNYPSSSTYTYVEE